MLALHLVRQGGHSGPELFGLGHFFPLCRASLAGEATSARHWLDAHSRQNLTATTGTQVVRGADVLEGERRGVYFTVSNSSARLMPRPRASFAAAFTDGLRRPASIPAMYERSSAARSASDSCVQSLPSRRCFTRQPNELSNASFRFATPHQGGAGGHAVSIDDQ